MFLSYQSVQMHAFDRPTGGFVRIVCLAVATHAYIVRAQAREARYSAIQTLSEMFTHAQHELEGINRKTLTWARAEHAVDHNHTTHMN